MGSILFMICFLFIIIREDIALRVRLLFHTFGEGTQKTSRVLDFVTATQSRVGHLLISMVRTLTGFRIECERLRGVPLPRTFLLVTNHQSLADIPVLYYFFPHHALRFVMKRELGRGIPMISLYSRVGGHTLISRTSDYREGRRELVKLARLASSHCISPVVFPEGTRSRTGRLMSFRTGAFRIILERTPLPVLSVAMHGGYSITRLTRIFTNLGKTHYKVKQLSLHPPPKGKHNILELLGEVEAEIADQLRAWRNEDK